MYRFEAHRFVEYFIRHGGIDLLNTAEVVRLMAGYLEDVLQRYVTHHRSRQTLETILAGLSKMEHAMNSYIKTHNLDATELDTSAIRSACSAQGRKLLPKSSRVFTSRAYPDPVSLIAALKGESLQLTGCLQYEGGARCEGPGAPSGVLKNPLTKEALGGIGTDPVTGQPVGIVTLKEKGGKSTCHYISVITYARLLRYLVTYGKLETNYRDYLNALNTAAKATGQYAPGRGTHGLKHSFALERYHQCVKHGFSHEQAMQQTSLELAHFRLRETLTYTRGQ